MKESENIGEYLDQRIEKAVEHESDGETNCNWWPWTVSKCFGKKSGGIWNQRPSKSTELLKSVRILRRVLETWGDLLSLRLIWKTTNWCEKFTRDDNNINTV